MVLAAIACVYLAKDWRENGPGMIKMMIEKVEGINKQQ